MALKTIETKAIISAQDQTGATFSAIAIKLKDMEGVAQRAGEMAGKVGGNFGAIAPKVDGASRSITAFGAAITAVAAIGVAKLATLAKSVVDIGVEFDKLTRRQQAVLNITPAQQAPLIAQAIRLGATTPFNDVQVLEAQTALAQRGIPVSGIHPIIQATAAYAQAQGMALPEAAKQVEAAYFGGGGRTEGVSPEELEKRITRIVDMMTKTAQVSGLTAEGLADFIRIGLPAGTVAAVSMPFFLAQGAAMQKAKIPGEEAGTAARYFATTLAQPTSEGLAALDALGIHFKDYAKAGTAMRAENLSAEFERTTGKKLSSRGLQQVQSILNNPAITGDQGKFTHALMNVLGSNLKPKDAREVAKRIEEFWKSSLESVDVEGLERALIAKHPSLPQLVALFGKRQAGRFGVLSQHPEDVAKFEKEIAGVPEGLAAEQAKKMMGGFAGAKMRAEGAWKNVLTTLFRDNEKFLTPLYNAEAKLETAFVEARPEVRALAEGAAAAAAALVGLAGTIAAMKFIDRAAGGGTIFGAGAAGLGWLGGALLPTWPAIAAGVGAGLIGGSTSLNAGENEFARQRRLGIGGGRWLSNEPPPAGTFSPTPGGLGAFRLEGAASIGVRVDVGFDPGLLAKQITQTLDAGGNLRADTGVTMPRR